MTPRNPKILLGTFRSGLVSFGSFQPQRKASMGAISPPAMSACATSAGAKPPPPPTLALTGVSACKMACWLQCGAGILCFAQEKHMGLGFSDTITSRNLTTSRPLAALGQRGRSPEAWRGQLVGRVACWEQQQRGVWQLREGGWFFGEGLKPVQAGHGEEEGEEKDDGKGQRQARGSRRQKGTKSVGRREKAGKPGSGTSEGQVSAATAVASRFDASETATAFDAPGGSDPLLLRGLDPDQRAAVVAPSGAVRLIAGPGSGKTRVLTTRVAHLISERGVDPREIVCVTFTRKASRELIDRLSKLIPDGAAELVTVGTFHSLCSRLLREFVSSSASIGRTEDFVIFDDADCRQLLKRVVKQRREEMALGGADGGERGEKKTEEKEEKKGKEEDDVDGMLDAIGWAKSLAFLEFLKEKRNDTPGFAQLVDTELGPGGALERGEEKQDMGKKFGVLGTDAVHLYEHEMRRSNAVDFDDLILLTVQLLHQQPEVLQMCRQRFSHLLVDEFQDTDVAQYELVRLLAGRGKSVFVVGDIDQAIYGWRGAKVQILRSLIDADFPSVVTMQLSRNYRSTGSIVEVASRLIRGSEVKREIGGMGSLRMMPQKPAGLSPALLLASSDLGEAKVVAQEIVDLHRQKEASYRGMAVLYRTNAQSRLFEEQFASRRIPFVVIGGEPFYARKEIKDLIAYLRFVANFADDAALDRIINVPPRGLGAKSIQSLRQFARGLRKRTGEALMARVSELPPTLDGSATIKPQARKALLSFASLIADCRQKLVKENASVGDVLEEIIERTDFLEYAKDLKVKRDAAQFVSEFVRVASGTKSTGPSGLISFLEEMALIAGSDVDKMGKDAKLEAEAVKLMTVHAAKGLEFPVVFLTGLEEGLMPTKETCVMRLAEERNVAYVGMTRAEEKLYLCAARRRMKFGRVQDSEISRYLEDMGMDAEDDSNQVSIVSRRFHDDEHDSRESWMGKASFYRRTN